MAKLFFFLYVFLFLKDNSQGLLSERELYKGYYCCQHKHQNAEAKIKWKANGNGQEVWKRCHRQAGYYYHYYVNTAETPVHQCVRAFLGLYFAAWCRNTTTAAAARDVFQHIWFIIWLRRNKRLSGYRKPLTLGLQSRYKKMDNLLLFLSETLRTHRWSYSTVGKLWRGKWKLLVFGVCHHPTCATD